MRIFHLACHSAPNIRVWRLLAANPPSSTPPISQPPSNSIRGSPLVACSCWIPLPSKCMGAKYSTTNISDSSARPRRICLIQIYTFHPKPCPLSVSRQWTSTYRMRGLRGQHRRYLPLNSKIFPKDLPFSILTYKIWPHQVLHPYAHLNFIVDFVYSIIALVFMILEPLITALTLENSMSYSLRWQE